MRKVIQIMNRCGLPFPTLERMMYISENLLAYSPTNRGSDGGSSWMSQRDPTRNCSEFELRAFKTVRYVFVHSLYSFLTLDDDLFGTRAADNPVKMLSQRKAEK